MIRGQLIDEKMSFQTDLVERYRTQSSLYSNELLRI